MKRRLFCPCSRPGPAGCLRHRPGGYAGFGRRRVVHTVYRVLMPPAR